MLRILLFISIALFASYSLAEQPDKINVQFLGALICPTKVNGKPWDRSKAPNLRASSIIGELVYPGSGIPIDFIAKTLNEVSVQGVGAPDVIGYVYQKGPTVAQMVNYAGIPQTLVSKLRIVIHQDSMHHIEVGQCLKSHVFSCSYGTLIW
ncbi:MAG: hypothetical protein GYB20_05745 [Oceanospirillales bacterium]|nr:hypothetical protein [Oceanospirillales bacterium]MBR9887183.1 hypothetical protein [Oceanospirillales bacterium]